MGALGNILISLAKIGVNVTERQVELIKWRTSDKAKNYYNRKANRKFYKELKKGNMKIVDAIRKEKQQYIEFLKKSIKIIVLIFSLFFFSSCIGIPDTYKNSYDVNSVRESERTYEFKNQNIRLLRDIKKTEFKGKWIIVHKDLLKTYNENQNSLISSLETQKNLHKKNNILMIIAISCGLVSIILFIILIIILTLRKKG